MLYPIVKCVVRIYYFFFFRLTVIGAENIPLSGGAILCGNHTTNWDPVTMAAYAPRLPRYMAKKELFSVFGVGPLIRNLHAFPVDRDTTDMTAFKTAIRILKSGEIVGMFAQGTRVKPGEEKAAKAGVALFAMKANVPVIPVAITGTGKLFSKMKIEYGKPLSLDAYRGQKLTTEVLNAITDEVMGAVNRMLGEGA